MLSKTRFPYDKSEHSDLEYRSLEKKLDFWLISFLESILVCIRVEVDPMLGYDYDITAYYEQR
jgi:hypothetical protein